MKKEYDFSSGVRGKFYRPKAEFNLPVYLDRDIAEFVEKLAAEKNIDRNKVVNKLLKKNKEIIEL